MYEKSKVNGFTAGVGFYSSVQTLQNFLFQNILKFIQRISSKELEFYGLFLCGHYLFNTGLCHSAFCTISLENTSSLCFLWEVHLTFSPHVFFRLSLFSSMLHHRLYDTYVHDMFIIQGTTRPPLPHHFLK